MHRLLLATVLLLCFLCGALIHQGPVRLALKEHNASATGRALINQGPTAGADRAELRADLSKPGVKVSPTLFGIFFEEINHAGDGGLYAEMIRNGSFEDPNGLDGWTASGDAKITQDSNRLETANPHALKIELGRSGGGVHTSGYWGIAVRRGAAYNLSLDMIGNRVGRTFEVWLEAGGKPVSQRASFNSGVETWHHYAATLIANADAANARLVIHADTPGTIWLDSLSLKPVATWKGHGLRADLAEKVAEMQPRFVRFPGGCYCEGEVLKDAFRWKNSVGPLEQRPGHWNLWGYRSTDHLGFHEYLQMCEDLGAEPLFVINVGMAHKEMVPLDQLDPWVQDALDAIEYANGPVTSHWGALRAKAGHPKPFGLKYMEIGNENGWGNTLPAYEARYARFHDAIKAKYPYVKLVSNVPIRNRRPDFEDEHYYMSANWFAANANKYDSYSRSRPKIYVGEYAVTSGCGQGNLRAALGEAAWMTGLERNGDIVAMASYAPLFVNVNDRKWNPDAICYNAAQSYATPSWYVQQMFSRNRVETAWPLEIKASSTEVVAPGMIGLGTWRTASEYKDIKVESDGRTLFASDFASGIKGWKVVRGDWSAADGVLRQTKIEENDRVYAGDPTWTDYTVTLKARKLSGAEGFLVMFRTRGDGDWYWWNIGGWNNTQHAIQKEEGGSPSFVGEQVRGGVETGRWYDIRIELRGPRIRCFLDGKLIHDAVERGPQPLYASLGRAGSDVVLKVVNFSNRTQDTAITLNGLGTVSNVAQVTTLTARSLDDENSFATPQKVAPRTSTLRNAGPRFTYPFPPNSVTVIRVPVRR